MSDNDEDFAYKMSSSEQEISRKYCVVETKVQGRNIAAKPNEPVEEDKKSEECDQGKSSPTVKSL